MLRFSAFFTAALIVFAIGTVLVSSPTVDAFVDNGPTIRVYGVGANATAAEQNAHDNMIDELVTIILDLPPDAVITDVIVDDEGPISATLYYIDFHVVYSEGGGNGGESGGGGGGGPAGN